MFCRKKISLLSTGLFAAFLSAPAWAEKSPADEIKLINEEIAVLSARLQKVDMEAKIAVKEVEVNRTRGTMGSPSAMDMSRFGSEAPIVKSIEGIDGKLSARLATRGGIEQTVREGEKIGVWTIKTITVNSVVIGRGSETTRLAFGNEPPAESQGQHNPLAGSSIPPFAQPR